jgi:hypothetical protein
VPERKLGFFVKIKEDDPPPNFGGLTTVILVLFRGLKFEPDADIGGKDSFRSGTIYAIMVSSFKCE